MAFRFCQVVVELEAMKSKLSQLSDTSKLWIFPLTENANPSQVQILSKHIENFIEGWNAHGAGVKGAFELFENRFLVVAADESDVQASGCSIDSLVAQVQDSLKEIGLELADFSEVFFRKGDAISFCSRVGFAQLAKDKEINSKTRVFDISLQQLKPYLDGGFELAFAESWHSKAFTLPE